MSETTHSQTPAAPATVIREFRLPDLGEGLTESEIVAWHVAAGDRVTLNQVIAEVETAKAVVEVAADAVRPPARAGAPGAGAGGGAPAPRREPNLVGYGAVIEATGRPARKGRTWAGSGPRPAEQAEPGPAVEATPVEPAAPAPRTERPRSTPPVRKLAKDLGVDLAGLTGTGPTGLITRDDVLIALGAAGGTAGTSGPEGAPAAEAGAAVVRAPGERETRTPIKGVRKHTAAAMVASAFTAPHASEFLTVDVTPSMELLTRLRESRAFAHLKLTPLTLVAKAVLLGLRRNPTLNSHWDEAAQEIVQYHYVNLGIAAATPRGLVVPTIKDADAMTLAELAEALADLAATAREGHTRPADLSGGTISITNIGVFGIDAGTPILNPGEAAIIAVGQVRRLPWEFEGQVALREVMTLSLSFDHRLVDGEQASRFLADVGAILADPGIVLTMV